MCVGGGVQRKSYILIYSLYFNDTNDVIRKYAHALSKKTGLKIIRICFNYKQLFRHKSGEQKVMIPDVFSFVSLIDNARYVLTDSFHGTAFSLNLNTEPICIYPQRFSTRIESILRLTKTLHRHVESYDDFDILNRPVNFDEVNQILNAERKKASDWLKMIISEIREHKMH